MARSAGRSIFSFRKGLAEGREELREIEEGASSAVRDLNDALEGRPARKED